MTIAAHSIHFDLAPETVFDRLLDPTIVPPGIVLETVHESTGGVVDGVQGPRPGAQP